MDILITCAVLHKSFALSGSSFHFLHTNTLHNVHVVEELRQLTFMSDAEIIANLH